MGLRFRKSIRIAPGVRLNVGLRRTSVSFGGRGFTYNVGSNGSRLTVGIPGSGLSYSTPVTPSNPGGLIASAIPPRRRYSLTPFVIVAFLFGLLYLAVHSSSQNSAAINVPTKIALPEKDDVTGSTAGSGQQFDTPLNGPIPLPRPRPKTRNESIGPPLQLLPPERAE